MTNARSTPLHRTILAVDIEGSTGSTDPVKARLRAALYELLESALLAAGIDRRHHDPLIDRGDGALTLIRPVDRAPKTVLLDTVVPALGRLLAGHNARRPADRFRLRAVVHAGEVLYDGRGCFGESLDVAFRLLDDERVKRALRRSREPLVLVTSDDIYRSIIRHGYEGIDPDTYAPCVQLEVGGRTHQGWLRTTETVAAVKGRERPVMAPVISLDGYRRHA
ncbi:hypothetical protein GCM10023085_09280 [Actinomadura viridis]|uniref:Guanylate cyclase domain-containing protein n=1 Tax=Actinomadura viridis TaxID=58110 RepID=A0A931GME7_9ACTN|nr:hypothetical protein [Actinomadura viridis]MBG6091940.1 hypothetical protein [Actinomadura viridis]